MGNATTADYHLDIIDQYDYSNSYAYDVVREKRLRISRKKAAANRRKALRLRRTALFFVGIILVLVIVIGTGLFVKASNESSQDLSFKYYTQIVVKPGQTLSSIATEYSDAEHYKSMQDYVNEVVSINSITDPDCIQSGCVLVVPYYSNEYK